MNNEEYYTARTFASQQELVSKSIKTNILNGIKQQVSDLQVQTEREIILDALDVHLKLIEDCYNIDMYKFQFKLFVSILNKELDNIKQMILYEEST